MRKQILLLKSLFLDKMVIEAARLSGSGKEMRCSEIWRSCQHEPGTGHFSCRKTYGNGESCGPGQDSPEGVRNRNNFLALPRTSDRIIDTGCAYQPSPRVVCPTSLCSRAGAWAAGSCIPRGIWGSAWWQRMGWLGDVCTSVCHCGADVVRLSSV